MSVEIDDKRPPKTLKVIYCDKCGRTDEVQPLKDRHFADGVLCGGKLKVAVYKRED